MQGQEMLWLVMHFVVIRGRFCVVGLLPFDSRRHSLISVRATVPERPPQLRRPVRPATVSSELKLFPRVVHHTTRQDVCDEAYGFVG